MSNWKVYRLQLMRKDSCEHADKHPSLDLLNLDVNNMTPFPKQQGSDLEMDKAYCYCNECHGLVEVRHIGTRNDFTEAGHLFYDRTRFIATPQYVGPNNDIIIKVPKEYAERLKTSVDMFVTVDIRPVHMEDLDPDTDRAQKELHEQLKQERSINSNVVVGIDQREYKEEHYQ